MADGGLGRRRAARRGDGARLRPRAGPLEPRRRVRGGRPALRRPDGLLALDHVLRRPHAGQARHRGADVAAVRPRPRDRQRAVLPRLRARARPCAAPLPDALRGHVGPAPRPRPRRSAPRWWPCSCSPRRRSAPGRTRRRPPCATWSARRTATAASAPRPARGRRRCTRAGPRSAWRRRDATRATSTTTRSPTSARMPTRCAATWASARGPSSPCGPPARARSRPGDGTWSRRSPARSRATARGRDA